MFFLVVGLFQEPLPLGRTDDLLQYSQEIWEDLDDASNRVAALHRAEALSFFWMFFFFFEKINTSSLLLGLEGVQL